jgi:hypothetical protein
MEHVARMGEERSVYKVLVGKSEGKRPVGRRRNRWEDWIRMDLSETGWGSVDWIQLAQDRDRWRAVVSAVMNLRVLVPRSYLVSLLGGYHTFVRAYCVHLRGQIQDGGSTVLPLFDKHRQGFTLQYPRMKQTPLLITQTNC